MLRAGQEPVCSQKLPLLLGLGIERPLINPLRSHLMLICISLDVRAEVVSPSCALFLEEGDHTASKLASFRVLQRW